MPIVSNVEVGTTSYTIQDDISYAHAVTNKGSAFSSGLYKITTNSEGHVTAATAVAKADITTLGIASDDTATTSAAGLMSSTDKTKLDGIASGANKCVFLSYGSSTWDDFETAFNSGATVYCRASSSSTNPGSGSLLRIGYLAYINSDSNLTEAEFHYVRSLSSKSNSQLCDNFIIYTLNKTSGWSFKNRYVAPKQITGANGITTNMSSNTLTISGPAAPPTTDGTYTLQVTVSNGTPTYSWV